MQSRTIDDVPGRDAPRVSSLDLKRFAVTPLERDPFDYLVVPGFKRPEACDTLDAAVMKRELTRHGLSAWTKRLFDFGAAAG